jgi:flagellar biosynthesis GTPase FlhF
MEQDVEKIREKSGDDVTIRRAKEVRHGPTTLTMDTEDEQTEERQVPEHPGKPRSGEGGGGELNTVMQRTTQHRRRKQPARSGPKS